MSWFGGKKETPAETTRKQNREISRAQRQVQRTNVDLEREEKKLEAQIKQLAKQGQNQACKMLAKQLVAIRNQKTRNVAANSRIGAIGAKGKMMNANNILANAMASGAGAMKTMNDQMDSQKIAAMLKQFEEESAKFEMTDEMIEESLESILDNSDDEQEQDAVVNQILDELAIDVNQKLSKAKAPASGDLDFDLDALLAGGDKKKDKERAK